MFQRTMQIPQSRLCPVSHRKGTVLFLMIIEIFQNVWALLLSAGLFFKGQEAFQSI